MFRNVGVLSVLALICSASLWAAPPDQKYVLRFGGFSDTPLSGDVSLPSQITVEAWIRLESYGTGGLPSIAGRRRSGDPFIDFEIGLDSERTRRLELRMSTGQPGTQRSVTSNVDIPLNEWTHVAATFDGTTMRLFENGELRGSDAAVGAPPATGTESFIIGSPGLHALLRQVRIWSRALNAAELIDRSSRTVAATEVGLVHSWPLDEGDGQVARDRAVSGVNLRLGSTDDFDENDPRWARTVLIDDGPYFVLDGPLSVWDPNCGNEGVAPCPNTAKLIDFDHDGDLDVISNRSDFDFRPSPMIAIRNDRTSFADATTTVFPQPVLTIANVDYLVADFSGDGLPDLFVEELGEDRLPHAGGQNQILIGSVTGQLLNETTSRLPQVAQFTHSATAADIDGDHDLDLYLGNGCCAPMGPTVLINDGAGHFRSAPDRLPAFVRDFDRNFSASLFVDVDNDGDPDLFLGTAGSPDLRDTLLLNEGTGHFTQAPETALPLRPRGPDSGAFFAASADFDRNGFLDLVMWHYLPGSDQSLIAIYLNEGGVFRDGSAMIDRQPPRGGQSLYPVDFNNDGWVDLVFEAHGRPPMLYLNVSGRLVDVSEVLPTFLPPVSVFLPGDLDLDGDIDFYAHAGASAFRVNGVKPLDAHLLVEPRRRAVRR